MSTKFLASVLLAAAIVVQRPASARQDVVRFRVTLQSTWTAGTHPVGYPPNPHFSGLAGAVHDDQLVLWASGAPASDAVEQIAETGGYQLLQQLTGHSSHVWEEIAGPGIQVSLTDSASYEFGASRSFPFVTILSMLAPSPDWFVGVAGLDLRDGPGWKSLLEIPAIVYDAGTDSGSTYTAADADTQPRAPIAALTDPPFDQNPVVGVWRFERIVSEATGRDRLDGPLNGPSGLSVWPNPVRSMLHVRLSGAWSVPPDVEVFDVLGRLRHRTVPRVREGLVVDVSGWAAGMYVIRAGVATQVFVVQP